MPMLRRHAGIVLSMILASAAPALALFDVKDPLSKRYASESRAVIAGTITAVNPANHVLTIKPVTLYKGPALADGEVLQIQINLPESLQKEAQPNQSVVVFKGAKSAAVHIADHWYLADVLEKPNQFRTTARLPAAYDETFPGTTAELIKALDEIKAGKSTLLDAFPAKLDFPAPQKVTTLPAHATAFTALQLTPGGPVTFFVATTAGLHALTWDNAKLDDQTQSLGLANFKPTTVAATPDPFANHKPTLILDAQMLDFDRKNFRKSADLVMPQGKILGVAVGDFADRGNATIAFLTEKGLLRTSLINTLPSPGLAPHDEAPIPLDDDTRLTGAKLTDYLKLPDNTFSAASMAFVDVNHDDRPDLVIATPQGVLTLLNRGFGCFLVNKDFATPLLDPAKTGKPAMPLLASTPILDASKKPSLTILWALQDDGTLYRYDFSPK